MDRLRVSFPCDELSLEGEWLLPDGAGPFPSVIVAHPFPPHGGTMHSSVVTAIWEMLAEKGIAAFRFNFRGTGGSEGRFDDGMGEQDDIRAALAYVLASDTADRKKVGLAGYSFGAMMSVPVALEDNRIQALAVVSAPLPEDVWKRLDAYDNPYMVVAGEDDHMVDLGMFRARMADTPGAGEYRLLPDADHFLGGSEETVGTLVSGFFFRVFTGS